MALAQRNKAGEYHSIVLVDDITLPFVSGDDVLNSETPLTFFLLN